MIGAKNIDQLKNRINYCLDKISPNLIQTLASLTTKSLDLVRRYDIIEKR